MHSVETMSYKFLMKNDDDDDVFASGALSLERSFARKLGLVEKDRALPMCGTVMDSLYRLMASLGGFNPGRRVANAGHCASSFPASGK